MFLWYSYFLSECVYIHMHALQQWKKWERILNKLLVEVLKTFIPAVCTTVSPLEAAGFCEAVARDSFTAFIHSIMRQLSDKDQDLSYGKAMAYNAGS